MHFAALLAAWALTAVACGDDDKTAGQNPLSEAEEQEQLAALRAEIESMIGLDGPVATCRALGLGAKPCGGPWRYVIYSTARTDSAILVEKVERYNAWEADMNTRYGRISDCALVVEPALGTRDGQCVAVDPSMPQMLVPASDMATGTKSDPFTVGAVRIEGDLLTVEVRFSGGCAQHDFTLLDTGVATRSIPPQHRLRIVHDAHGDSCEAYLSRTLTFDISPLRKVYSSLDRVAVQIEGIEGTTLYTF